MHDDARRYWAWFLSGVVLDAVLASLSLMVAMAFVPSLVSGGIWRVVLLGSVLAIVHLALMPALIWPANKLTAHDLGIAFVRVVSVLPATLFGAMVGVFTGAGAFPLLSIIAALFTLPFTTRSFGETVEAFAILACVGVAYLMSGATCGTLVAGLARTKLCRPGQVAIGVRTAALGGGVAALLLVGVSSLGVNWQLLDLNASALLQVAVLIALAGVPHSLLTCRDLARQPPVLATLPVAARRLLILLAALEGSSGLLMAVTRH